MPDIRSLSVFVYCGACPGRFMVADRPGALRCDPHFCFALVNDLPSQEDLKMKIVRFTLSLAVAVLLAASLSAQNVVSQWNAIASTAIVATAKESPAASGVWFAYVHLAVFDAVNAFDHRFQPYLFTTNPPATAAASLFAPAGGLAV